MSDESIDKMNRGLANNINARVGPNDILWCLGDWVFGRGHDYYHNARWFRDQIQCRTILFVWGNHDDRRIRDLFAATYDQAEIREGEVSDHPQPLPDADLERAAPRLGGFTQHPSLRSCPRHLSE